MEKVVIFGGMGFIGKNLIDRLIKNYEVIVIDRNKDEEYKNFNRVDFFHFDFSKDSVADLKQYIEQKKPEFVINLISIVTASRDIELFSGMIESNLNILLKLYDVFKEKEWLKLFINFGSAEEYGNVQAPFRENMKEEPMSPYALAKQLTTNTSIMLNKNENFPIMVLRPSNLFGRYQDKNKFIPYIVEQLKKNREVVISPGEQKRDFIYAEDFSYGVEKILENYEKFYGEIINLGSGKSNSLKEIITFLKKEMNSTSNIKFGGLPYRKNEVMDFKVDIKKIEEKIEEKLEFNLFENLKKIQEEG